MHGGGGLQDPIKRIEKAITAIEKTMTMKSSQQIKVKLGNIEHHLKEIKRELSSRLEY